MTVLFHPNQTQLPRFGASPPNSGLWPTVFWLGQQLEKVALLPDEQRRLGERDRYNRALEKITDTAYPNQLQPYQTLLHRWTPQWFPLPQPQPETTAAERASIAKHLVPVLAQAEQTLTAPLDRDRLAHFMKPFMEDANLVVRQTLVNQVIGQLPDLYKVMAIAAFIKPLSKAQDQPLRQAVLNLIQALPGEAIPEGRGLMLFANPNHRYFRWQMAHHFSNDPDTALRKQALAIMKTSQPPHPWDVERLDYEVEDGPPTEAYGLLPLAYRALRSWLSKKDDPPTDPK